MLIFFFYFFSKYYYKNIFLWQKINKEITENILL